MSPIDTLPDTKLIDIERFNGTCIYTVDNIEESKRYVFVVDKVGGLGDVSCAMQFASRIQEKMNLKAHQVLLAVNPEDAKDVELFNEKSFAVINACEIGKVHNLALQVIAPQVTSKTAEMVLYNQAPVLSITEYGFSPHKFPPYVGSWVISRAMGLAVGEIGILIDQELMNWGFSEATMLSQNRAMKIREMSSGLQDALLRESGIFEFDSRTKLYYGYSAHLITARAFVCSICKINAHNSKNISVYLPNEYVDELSKERLKNSFIKGSSEFTEFLMNDSSCKGFGRVIVEKYDCIHETTTTIEELKSDNSQSKKVLRILIGRLPHRDVRLLMMASEKEMVVTGDQSLSEAISCNKNFAYELLWHKSSLAESIERRYSSLESANDVWQRVVDTRKPNLSCMISTLVNAFIDGATDNYERITKINLENCKRDCIEPAAHLAKLLLKEIAKPHFINLKQKMIVDDKDLPLNEWVFVNPEAYKLLQIDDESHISERDEFAGSFFEVCLSNKEGGYYIKRKKLEEYNDFESSINYEELESFLRGTLL